MNFLNMFNIKKNKKGGFTLIELLIVIAIIGVLAATVVVSLGSQTDSAKEGSAKVGVSSVRNLATVSVVDSDRGTTAVCEYMYPKVSGEKGSWDWGDGGDGNECNAVDSTTAAESGQICCASSDTDWVIWSALPTDGKMYCTDSGGYSGEITKDGTPDSTKSVVKGNASTSPTGCVTPAS